MKKHIYNIRKTTGELEKIEGYLIEGYGLPLTAHKNIPNGNPKQVQTTGDEQ